ncbi:MAG: FAD-dependent monooxygenase [Nitrospirae bacterium]|nr:MAG: FAD-dependent monooxygenase [Nitrospirota bacterium]
MKVEVVVVGAGGGGAVLGLALAQQGVSVLVLERQPGPPADLRGETIQPNGQRILEQLGILPALTPETVQAVSRFHFVGIGGERLCTMDYEVLPAPHNRALVALSGAVHHLILGRLSAQKSAQLWYGTEFQGLVQQGGRVGGVVVRRAGEDGSIEVEAQLVVGADGAGSLVRRALGVNADVHRYRQGYLIMLLPRPEGMQGEARYYVGRGELLGLFPAPGERVVALYMVETDAVEAFKARGLAAFKARVGEIDAAMAKPLESLTAWEQVGFLPCTRVRTDRWVVEGAALIGDAAHAMNPHASQGRMQAMADAMALAEVIMRCRVTGDWSARALSAYERARRPQVEMLQRLADEQVLFWNAADPVRCFLRDRVFRGMDRNARLRYQALMATAGLRMAPPLTWMDKFMAAGFLPDSRADEIPR